MTPAERIVCVRHRAAEERARPGFWRWSEAPKGLSCEIEGCPRSADAKGTPARGLQTPEVRARMSAAAKKALADPEVRARMSAAQRGKKRSAETRARISAALTGVKRGPYKKRRAA